jgi:hypothetical protein
VAVNDLSLGGKITAPTKGAAPVATAIDTVQYTGTVAWQTADGAAVSGSFGASTVYKALITLTAKSGFTFAGLGADSFSYTDATSVANAADSGTVAIVFPATADPDQDQDPGTKTVDLVFADDGALTSGDTANLSMDRSKQETLIVTAMAGLMDIRWSLNGADFPAPRANMPVGKGVVRVETGAAAARTAVPSASFARYEYWFARDSDAALERTAVEGVFELEEGSYTVTVKAFVAAGDTSPATQGTSDAFTITAGADAGSISVILAPVIGAGNGTLSFALVFPDTAELTAFTLTRVGGSDFVDLEAAGTADAGTLPWNPVFSAAIGQPPERAPIASAAPSGPMAS